MAKKSSKTKISKMATKKPLPKSKADDTSQQHPKLASVWRLSGQTCSVLGRNWKLFGGVLLIYAILYVILVGGISNGSLADIKKSLDQTFSGGVGTLSTGLAIFSYLISSSTATASSAASAYQSILILLFSVILIWTLRQTYAVNKVRVRDSFYDGVYPIIPFILVLIVVLIQMIPLALGAALYTVVIGGGIAVTGLEQILTIILALLLAILSIYMLLSSVFALYIVTLPDMTPMKALRSARGLARGRRLVIFGKILFMVVAILVVGTLIIVPLAILVTPIVAVAFFIISIIALAVVHGYMYGLYRELLK